MALVQTFPSSSPQQESGLQVRIGQTCSWLFLKPVKRNVVPSVNLYEVPIPG